MPPTRAAPVPPSAIDMNRVLSTYLFSGQRLTLALLAEIEQALLEDLPAAAPPGVRGKEVRPGVEIFCTRHHFDYRAIEVVREIRDWFADRKLRLHSLHAPTSRDSSAVRESAAPISIADLERTRRLDAVDEIKRAIDVAETIPFRILVLHFGGREAMDERRRDAAFSSLEHLTIFAKQRGVTIALENTPGDLATPGSLRHFIEDTRLHDLRLCFDAGHAHMGDGVVESFDIMRDYVITAHIHDNHGERDEHLFPGEGTINWEAACDAMQRAPAAPDGLPMVLEIKEPVMTPGVAANLSSLVLLDRAADSFARLERTLGQRAA